ncbi:MAG TPA: hypothetical protein VIJ35_00600 [Bradyrhizobium sp.]|jgi:hypothetical protein
MSISDQPSSASRPEDVSNPVDEAELEHVLETVPRGAFALAGIALGLLMLAWLAIYFFVFLPRGPVG